MEPCYRVAGKHYIDVFWSGYALPRSPYHGYATEGPEEMEFPTVHVRAASPANLRYTSPVYTAWRELS